MKTRKRKFTRAPLEVRWQRMAARFWAKVDKRGPDECWEWTGMRTVDGYGRIKFDRRRLVASRVLWEITHGENPGDKHVCHKCDNPPCCNPAHLFLGTPLDNVRDMLAKGRCKPPRGEDHAHARLADSQVREIRELLAAGELHRVIAARFGVHKSTISAISIGRIRKSA